MANATKKKTLEDARRFVRNNPAAVLIGAFIIGVVVAKVARHA